MNKYASHFLAFIFGAVLTGVASYITLGEIGKLFLIESQNTDQKLNLTSLKLIRESKTDNAIRMLESLACTYLYINSEQSLSETKKETEEYFSKYYPQGNNPCSYHSGDGAK